MSINNVNLDSISIRLYFIWFLRIASSIEMKQTNFIDYMYVHNKLFVYMIMC